MLIGCLDLFEDPFRGTVVDKVDGDALPPKTRSAPDSVHVRLGIRVLVVLIGRKVVVNNDRHLRYVYTTCKYVRCDEHLRDGKDDAIAPTPGEIRADSRKTTNVSQTMNGLVYRLRLG